MGGPRLLGLTLAVALGCGSASKARIDAAPSGAGGADAGQAMMASGGGGGTTGGTAGASGTSGGPSSGPDASRPDTAVALADAAAGGRDTTEMPADAVPDRPAPLPDGAAGPASVLHGTRWEFPCTRLRQGDFCDLIPAGTACPAGGAVLVDRSFTFGGTPGQSYQVTIRFRGKAEQGDYTGGKSDGDGFRRGGMVTPNPLHLQASLEISAPAQLFYVNDKKQGPFVASYDYTKTITIEGGATIKMRGLDSDCVQHRGCENDVTNPCRGFVIPDVPPAPTPYEGNFVHMDVVTVVPAN